MDVSRKRGGQPKPADQKARRLQVTLPPDLAEIVRRRGGSRYLASLVRRDAAENPA